MLPLLEPFHDWSLTVVLRQSGRFLWCSTTQHYKTCLKAETCAAIAGLDAVVFSFGRAERCGTVPKKLARSYQTSGHLILSTAVSAAEWAERHQGVSGFNELVTAVQRELPSRRSLSLLPPRAGGRDAVLPQRRARARRQRSYVQPPRRRLLWFCCAERCSGAC
ncbi:ATP-dependent RNA helicase [Leishmania donovani]|uniref:Hypothetical_protein_conserved n=1 Tax=Leishmania donovani TaxID=5661 RepID=A0A6J8FIK9_LEIDO|nr:ATP-dependent RNA helicase [Leishmania donovani]VDZ47049.1 hypothetical_protein_conserved [Leishmania donovani]